MHSFLMLALSFLAVVFLWLVLYIAHQTLIAPRFNPLREIAGPPVPGWFGNHLHAVLDPVLSPRVHDLFVQRYGRSIRLRGLGPWDERLLALDPASVTHVLKNYTIYEKPWQSRKLISGLIGCGLLSAEGQVHKRQRRVATPAFSIQNLRALVPLVFRKGNQLKNRWMDIVLQEQDEDTKLGLKGVQVDVYHWISRATFDVIGLAGFDYNFNAIQDESNELFCAYREMFDVALNQGPALRKIISLYLPFVNTFFPNNTERTVQRCQEVIHRVAGHLIQEKKDKIFEAKESNKTYDGKDLLSLFLKSNAAEDLPVDQRISDEDILNNINTVMFAGTDTSSLTLTWALLLLAQTPLVQERLRAELLSLAPTSATDTSDLTEDEIQSLHAQLADLPYLHNVTRETLRLIPPLHSSLRVATQDDEIPTLYPIRGRDGKEIEGKRSLTILKGSFVHVAIEAFNLDKAVWGEDAWDFNPDRWDNLPDKVQEQPGVFSSILSFSAGPRSCVGVRFSMIEIKTFLYILLTNFVFNETDEKVIKANVVLTRPFLAGKFKEGSQCPLLVSPYISTPTEK